MDIRELLEDIGDFIDKNRMLSILMIFSIIITINNIYHSFEYNNTIKLLNSLNAKNSFYSEDISESELDKIFVEKDGTYGSITSYSRSQIEDIDLYKKLAKVCMLNDNKKKILCFTLYENDGKYLGYFRGKYFTLVEWDNKLKK